MTPQEIRKFLTDPFYGYTVRERRLFTELREELRQAVHLVQGGS